MLVTNALKEEQSEMMTTFVSLSSLFGNPTISQIIHLL